MATPITCTLCGRVADPDADGDPPLAWCTDTDSRDKSRTRWICPGCARDNVRGIEAKLDPEFW